MKRFLFFAVLVGPVLLAQALEDPVILTIDTENAVLYRGLVFDASKLAKDPGPTTSVNTTFGPSIVIGDIVAVNGKPAKGIWQYTVSFTTPYKRIPQPGQPIADVDSTATLFCTWQIYATDGTYLGMIRDSGTGATGQGGHAVVGALANLFGAIGTHTMNFTVPSREATTAEDPANRRNLGGGKMTAVFYLYPRVRPSVQITATGPSIFHTDYSPVTAANPAHPGELLILGATGLGPVRPLLEPPGAIEFSGPPYQEVNSPVTVRFNGKELPVTNKIGWPGQKSLYWVDFQVPSDASSGTATLQLIATWIPGPVVTIPVSAR